MKSFASPRARGFTLFELMLTLAVAAVLAAVAIPNMRDFLRNNRLASTSNDLIRSMQVARSEAIKRQRNVVVCASADPSAAEPTCNYGNFRGWIVFQDGDGDWQVDADDPGTAGIDEGDAIIERHDLVDASVTVKNDRDGIFSYGASGFPNPAGAQVPSTRVVICDIRGNQAVGNDSAARAIIVAATGRFRLSRDIATVATAMGVTGGCPT